MDMTEANQNPDSIDIFFVYHHAATNNSHTEMLTCPDGSSKETIKLWAKAHLKQLVADNYADSNTLVMYIDPLTSEVYYTMLEYVRADVWEMLLQGPWNIFSGLEED